MLARSNQRSSEKILTPYFSCLFIGSLRSFFATPSDRGNNSCKDRWINEEETWVNMNWAAVSIVTHLSAGGRRPRFPPKEKELKGQMNCNIANNNEANKAPTESQEGSQCNISNSYSKRTKKFLSKNSPVQKGYEKSIVTVKNRRRKCPWRGRLSKDR